MILFYKTQIARTNEVRDQAIVMAMELQFTALNRVSELLPTAAQPTITPAQLTSVSVSTSAAMVQ